MNIKITKDGPYVVSKDIPLNELIIKRDGMGYIYEESKVYNNENDYHLCRCGKSKKKPYCDGSHIKYKFKGDTKIRNLRMKRYENDNLIMEDTEELCAFARFCHAKGTDVWNILEDNNKEDNKLIEKLVNECPAGRLVLYDKSGNKIENKLEPSISVLQDPERSCMGPLWVKGNIPIEDENGNKLEVRNRVTLCRCGDSTNKPYCDTSHVYSSNNEE